MVFIVVCKCGDRKRVLGKKGAFVGCQTGIFMTRGTHSTIIEKCSRKD
jgi:hypothetical protein